LGIPVFNTPGANANAVKELVIAGMFLGSRRVIDGINHMKELGRQGLAKERVEKDKSKFGGREIMGKTLAVIGLGKYCLCLVILFVGSFYLFTDCKVLYHASNGSTS
jgi:phosphoglycerate dehydrogenase-like enzyme